MGRCFILGFVTWVEFTGGVYMTFWYSLPLIVKLVTVGMLSGGIFVFGYLDNL